jgi:hypothetical protein
MSEVISTYEGMEHIDVPCHNCGDPVRALIVQGGRPPRKVCHRCQYHRRFDVDSPQQQRADLALLAKCAYSYWGQNGPVRIFRPGEPGFKQRAEQVLLRS